VRNIKSLKQANEFIQKTYIKEHNKRFASKADHKGTAFIPINKHIDLERIFAIKEMRTVNADNTVCFKNLNLQIPSSKLRVSFAKCRVAVAVHLDKTISISYGHHLIGKYEPNGKPLIPKKNNKRRAA